MEPDKEEAEVSTKEWDKFCEKYQDAVENYTIPSSVLLYSATKASKASRICEIGAGCGLASRMFISTAQKEDSVFFACDISEGMNKIFVENLEKSDTALNPNFKVEWIKGIHEKIDVEKHIEDMGPEITRKVFCNQADAEKLPYPDECFDVYVSNLTMMLVNNYKNQISECYRVLKKGGTAGIATVGRPENSSYVSFYTDVLKSLGHDVPSLPENRLFNSGKIVQLEKDFRELGFSEVKLSYAQSDILFKDEKEATDIQTTSPLVRGLLDNLSEEEKARFYEEVKVKWNEVYGVGSIKPMTRELLVCVVTK